MVEGRGQKPVISFWLLKSVRAYHHRGKREFIGVKNLGSISFDGRGGLTRYFFCRNVFAIYEILTDSVRDNEQFSTKITLISFEKSPVLFEVAKAELYKKILMFRSELKTE